VKVLHFCNLAPRKTGAYEAVVCAIAARCREQGDTYRPVFAAEPIAPVAEGLRAAGAPWHVLSAWIGPDGRERPWGFCRPALRLLRLERPDVAAVHFGNELPSLFVSLLAPIAARPRVRWVWEQDQQVRDPSGLARCFSRLGLLRATFSRFVAVYDGGRRSLRLRGIPDDRIEVIHNGVGDCRATRPAGWLRAELGLPSGSVVAVSAASLIARKRIDFLIRAVGQARADVKAPVALLVVGDGPLAESLEALATDLGLGGSVRFLGLRNDVRDILSEADLLVHASTAETCTYAISEAMAAALPAVVTDAGAAREQIADGESGYVVARDDAAGFADRLAWLIADPAARRRMGQAARARWAAHYRIEEAAARFADLYRRVAD
jgi:glycosyltransferase involved in cell wall biosynthesis